MSANKRNCSKGLSKPIKIKEMKVVNEILRIIFINWQELK